MTGAVSRQEEKAALERVLASETFAKSQSLARLLRYLCTRYFEGQASEMKEYSIGVEVFGRSPNFDPTSNSIVRVELYRLREKLKRHYGSRGISDSVVILLEPGTYTPRFLARAGTLTLPPSETGTPSAPTAREASTESESPERVNALMPIAPTSERISTPEPGWPRRGLIRLVIPALVVILGCAALALTRRSGRLKPFGHTVSRVPGFESVGMAANTIPTGQTRILAGDSKSRYIDRAGDIWDPDRFYSGGTALSRLPQFIDRTSDPTLYQNCRSGDFTYDVPLGPGIYELHLYFAETTYGPNTLAGGGESSRIFNVDLNGRRVLSEFDPLADAGANNTADERVFKDVSPAPDGRLHLHLSKFEGPNPSQDDPILNALEITPGIRGKMLPLLIVAQNNSFTDHAGRVWVPDRYACQGRLVLHNLPVEHTADPGLYCGERFGHFSYAIPAAEGKYAVTLYFAETYFGPQNRGGGGAGSRIFDVYCNGLQIAHNLDIFKETGGANRALVKTFHNLAPSPQGKLLLTFVPTRNYACVNAIEVNSEE